MSDLDYAILTYLETRLEAHPALASAISVLEQELSVRRDSAEDFSTRSYYPTGLEAIFQAGTEKLALVHPKDALSNAQKDGKFEAFVDAVAKKGFFNNVEVGSVEYLQRQAKLVNKFKEKSAPAVSDTATKEAEAEVKKGLGNTAITQKDYKLAVQMYTEALDLSPAGPNSHVYYSNRAAAYCYMNDYKSAISDCEASIALEPNYAKAVARLANANYFEGNYEASVAAYERAVELEPDNKSSVEALQKARNKLKKQSAVTPGGAGGMPDLSSLAGMMGGGGGGGMPDMASLMKNPELMSMAQKMMSNPDMMSKAQEMMKDPKMMEKAMSMFGGGGGAGGGMPDLSALAGMMGGGPPAAPGSSSRGSKKGNFTGFGEDD